MLYIYKCYTKKLFFTNFILKLNTFVITKNLYQKLKNKDQNFTTPKLYAI